MERSTLAIIIVLLAIVSFALEKIPVALTAILASLAMAIFGITDYSKAYSDFGSQAAVMVAAMMICGNACFDNGVAQAMGNKITKIGLGKNERLLVTVMTGFAVFLSAFFSNSAVVAMMIPLVASVVSKSGGRCTNKRVLMAVGMGSAAGGFCTLSGSTPQVAAQTILETTPGCTPMHYFTLAKAGIPLCLIVIIYFATVGYWLEKKSLKFEDVCPVELTNEEEGESKPVDKRKFWLTAIIMILVVAGFVSGIWNIAVVAMVGATLMILTGCVGLKDAFHGIDWNTIVVLACSQGFAKGMETSGAGQLIADTTLNVLGDKATVFVVLGIIIVLSVILTNIMSNIATGTMMFPIVIALANGMGVNPTTFVIAVVIACQCAFATPVGTPCVTQTMVGGYKFMDYVKIGQPLNIITTVAAVFLIPLCYGI